MTVALAACGSPNEPAEPPAWGSEAVQFFGELSQAYAASDFYGVLDFYSASAEVALWRGDNKGGGPISDLLRWNSGDLAQELLALHLGKSATVTLVRWPNADELGAIASTIEEGLIAGETVFGLAASLGRSLRASPTVISTYEGLYAAYTEAWTSGQSSHLARLYAPEATVRDELSGIEAVGLNAITELAPPGNWMAVTAAEVTGEQAPAGALPLYLGPSGFLTDPQQAVGVFRVADENDCVRQLAVHWVLENGLIMSEHRYQEVESFRTCTGDELPAGWWTGLGLPGPSDKVVTGSLRTTGAQNVAIHNGTPRLEELVQWGMQRFEDAGLAEPRVDSVTFEPSRGCEGVSGRVDDADDSRRLFVCIYQQDLCPGNPSCAEPALGVRVAMLHELGHAWMLDHVSDETRSLLLELSDRETWRGEGVPWADLGVEYAAEVLAWGLAEEAIPMVRLGAPPCAELAAAFELLTAVPPQRGDCSDG